MSNRPTPFARDTGGGDPVSSVPWPLIDVPPGELRELARTLASTRIDQALVLALIQGGLGGTDLAQWLAEPLLTRLQETDPLPAAWTGLVLQALRDRREVWEPAFLPDRARLRAHLLEHPGALLQGLYLQLLRPWPVALRDWRSRVETERGRAAMDWRRLCELRGDTPGAARETSLRSLKAQWRDWCGDALSDAILARCMARANALNRHERGVWDPLVAMDVLREHLHGTACLATLLDRVGLRDGAGHPVPRDATTAAWLRVAARARQDPTAGLPFPHSVAPRPRTAWALCSLLAARYAHDAWPGPRPAPLPSAPSATPRRAADTCGTSSDAAPLAAAPWPLWPGTQAGALTARGVAAAPSSGTGQGATAEPADPPFGGRRDGGGLRTAEALHTVSGQFTPDICARWLGVVGLSAADFNAALQTLLQRAGVPAAGRIAGDAAVVALFEHGDAMLATSLQRAEVPLFARQLLKRTSLSTRVYLVTLAVSRLYARIQPRLPDDAAMRDAALWMRSLHAYFQERISDPAVRRSVRIGDAAQWPSGPVPSTFPTSTTMEPTPAASWDPGMNASMLAKAVLAVLPGHASALPSVLTHVLGHSGFPDPADLEQAVQRLYASHRTTALIAQAMVLPVPAVDDVLAQWFFSRLADAPLDVDADATHLVQWQAQLRRRTPGQPLRGDWIAGLTPAATAALFQQEDAEGLQRVLAEAMPVPTASSTAWSARLRSVQRLGAWLESAPGQQRMAAMMRGQDNTGTALPRFLFGDLGLPAADGLSLLRGAVRHQLGNDTLESALAQARHSPSPILSLAVTLHDRHPLLQAEACLTHAAVLLAPAAVVAPSAAAVLAFPLPALPAQATLPPLDLHTLLRASGLALLEQLDPALPAWQAWELIAQTRAFTDTAQTLQRAVGGGGDAAALLARWILDHGVGAQRVATLTAALDGTTAREQPMQATRAALQAQLPAFASATARSLLWWLLVRQAGRPEWLVADLPEWLDHGRSLEGVSLLHGCALLDAVAPGATAQTTYSAIVGIPRQLVASDNRTHAERPTPWLQALVRPALRYAQAQAAVAGDPVLPGADTTDIDAALALVGQHQAALAEAAGQLARRAPQRMDLAARQLRDARVPTRYWNQTLSAIPQKAQLAAGLTRTPGVEAALVGIILGGPSLVRNAEDAIAQDTLQQLLVSGVYGLSGRPSVPQLYEQAFAVYRQQMTAALAAMLVRSLDMLCTADRQLLRRSRVTPLRVPAGPRGALLRCEGPVPTYFVLVPSAGYATRLVTGDRFDGQYWRSGLLHDPRHFASGHVADQSDPLQLQFLNLDRCAAGATLPPRNASDKGDEALANAVAALMYGDFFNRTREAELGQLTGMESLRQSEQQWGEMLAAFAVPFYGCVTGLAKGEYASAAMDCTVDALSMLAPAARLGRFLRSTTRMVLRGGEVSATALLRDTGGALLRLGHHATEQSGLALVRDLGTGTLHLGRQATRWVLDRLPAQAGRAVTRLRSARLEELQLRATSRAGSSPSGLDDIAPGFAVDKPLMDDLRGRGLGLDPACPRVRRHLDIAQCAGDSITLFGHEPSPTYDAPGDMGWFAGMQVTSYEPITGQGRLFLFDGAYWRQSRTETGFRFTRVQDRAVPAPRQHIRATLMGGEHQLVRVELHNPYPDHLMSVQQGAVIGRTHEGERALITRVAPGRFYVAALDGDTGPGQALALWPLEHQGFTAAQNDAVKTAWWGAFHYSQQCQLSGAALVDRFGSQLQRQLDQLDELGTLLEKVRSGSPYRFDNAPAQAVMSCAQSNCRYVEELRRQIGTGHWRPPRDDDHWIDDALRDLLNPVPPQDTTRAFHGLDATLESRFLTPKRGAAKTLALARLTLKDDPVPWIFHASSGQRKGRSLLPIANLDRKGAPAGWMVEGREVRAPHARYVDAQPGKVSIQRGDVAGVVPHHSLHTENLDGPLFNERNTRAYDAERNLYYRIEQYIEQGRLDPDQVIRTEVFSSRRICPSCHIAVGSLRARFPDSSFTVIERQVAPAAVLLDNRPGSAP